MNRKNCTKKCLPYVEAVHVIQLDKQVFNTVPMRFFNGLQGANLKTFESNNQNENVDIPH